MDELEYFYGKVIENIEELVKVNDTDFTAQLKGIQTVLTSDEITQEFLSKLNTAAETKLVGTIVDDFVKKYNFSVGDIKINVNKYSANWNIIEDGIIELIKEKNELNKY